MEKVLLLSGLVFIAITCFAQEFYDISTVNTIELTFEESNWDQLLDNLYAAGDEERLLASVVINGVEFDSVGVRYKGNSSYSTQNGKNPLNIKLDYIIDDQNFEGYGTLKLANGYKDPSFVRETLSYEIARNYMPASMANYANVYVNGSYIGLYTNVQDVDNFFRETHFLSCNDIRFKGELSSGGTPTVTTVFGYYGTDSTDYYNYYELESDTGWQDLIEFLDVFNNDSDGMENYLNVDNHLWMLAFDNLLVNLDSPINFGHNFYLFKDGADLFNPIIWDLNESFGVFSQILGNPPLNPYQLVSLDPFLNSDNSYFPIVKQVLNVDRYKKMYIAHMRTMIEEIFQSGWYETRANELQAIISEDYQADPNKFYTYTQFQQNIDSTVSTGGGPGGATIIGITELMDDRSEWILSQSEFQGDVPTIDYPTHSPEEVTSNSTVWFTTETTDTDEIWLYHRSSLNEKFSAVEMFDDGNHNDGSSSDGVFGISIPTAYQDIQYYFYAENNSQGSFLPARAAYEYFSLDVLTESGEIVINEINYHSSEDFDAEDWVELYNPDSEALNISGWEFKDEEDDHIFIIPDGTILAGNDYLVLCKDYTLFSDVFPTVTNVIGNFDFGLSGGGEPIRLFDAEGTLIDSVDYDDEDDWPILPDGNGNTLELIDPDYDNTLPESWQASVGHGTPGVQNSTGVSSEEDMIETAKMELSNYPNPFNPRTTICFTISENEKTELTVYNTKGQKVKILISEVLPAGSHTVVWEGDDENGKNLSSGIYLYRLTNKHVTKTQKMILMK